jgi:hypothetical protein
VVSVDGASHNTQAPLVRWSDGLDTLRCFRSTRRPPKCPHTQLVGILDSTPSQLSRLGLDQTYEPPHPPRQHTVHRNMFSQGFVNIWCDKCTKSTFEIFRTVGPQPKSALVDTFSHASCKNRRKVGKQSTFPTT